MPTKPPCPCRAPGCPALTADGYCDAHKRVRTKAYDDARGTACKRGYDHQWRKFRLSYTSRVPAICVDCNHAGPSKEMHIDHIIPLSQGGDKYNDDNLAWRCKSCHDKKTQAEQMGDGGKFFQTMRA